MTEFHCIAIMATIIKNSYATAGRDITDSDAAKKAINIFTAVSEEYRKELNRNYARTHEE